MLHASAQFFRAVGEGEPVPPVQQQPGFVLQSGAFLQQSWRVPLGLNSVIEGVPSALVFTQSVVDPLKLVPVCLFGGREGQTTAQSENQLVQQSDEGVEDILLRDLRHGTLPAAGVSLADVIPLVPTAAVHFPTAYPAEEFAGGAIAVRAPVPRFGPAVFFCVSLDGGVHLSKGIPVHDGRMGIFAQVDVQFSVVGMLMIAVVRIGLLVDGVAHIEPVLGDLTDPVAGPGGVALSMRRAPGGYAGVVQPLGDRGGAHAAAQSGEDPADHGGFLRLDHVAAVGSLPITVGGLPAFVGPVAEALADGPFHVAGDGAGFLLGQGSENGEEEF